MKRVLAIMAVFALVGCDETPNAKLNAAVKARIQPGINSDRISNHTTTMAVRTYAVGEEKGKRGPEITGAKCTLVSDELRAEIVTPGQVVLPNFRQKKEFEARGVPGSLLVTCKTPSLSGRSLVPVSEKPIAIVTGAGLAGVVVGLAISAAASSSTNWAYPVATNIELK